MCSPLVQNNAFAFTSYMVVEEEEELDFPMCVYIRTSLLTDAPHPGVITACVKAISCEIPADIEFYGRMSQVYRYMRYII